MAPQGGSVRCHRMTYGFYGAVVALIVFVIGLPFIKPRSRRLRDRRRAEERFASRMDKPDRKP